MAPAAAASAFENAPRANIARMMTSGTVRNAATNGTENSSVNSKARRCDAIAPAWSFVVRARDISGSSTVPMAIPITPIGSWLSRSA